MLILYIYVLSTMYYVNGGQMDNKWDSEYVSHGFESQCCQLVEYVTSLGKM